MATGGAEAARATALRLSPRSPSSAFRDRAVSDGAGSEAMDAAIAALRDTERTFTGRTRWIVRCHPASRNQRPSDRAAERCLHAH